jgi:hypothetical protein
MIGEICLPDFRPIRRFNRHESKPASNPGRPFGLAKAGGKYAFDEKASPTRSPYRCRVPIFGTSNGRWRNAVTTALRALAALIAWAVLYAICLYPVSFFIAALRLQP